VKFGLISLDFRRYPLERCFEVAARLGYDGVEIWGGRPHAWPFDMDYATLAQVKQLQRRYQLEIPMYTPAVLGMGLGLASTSAQERDDALRHYRRGIDVASALEVRRVLVVVDHPGFEASADDTWARLVENTIALADHAWPKGVALCFETLTPMESPVLTTSDDCVRLMADVGRDNVCAMLDVVPPTVACEPISSYFDKLGDAMGYIHLCGSDGTTDAHLALDQGVLSVPDVLGIISARGYDGFVTVEQYSASYRDPEAMAAQSIRLIRSWLG